MSQRGSHRKTASPIHVALRRTALGTISFLVASSGVGVAQASGLLDDVVTVQAPPTAHVAQDQMSKRVAHLEGKHHCSTDGLAEGVVPAHTVVVVDGRARLATFDEGWAM